MRTAIMALVSAVALGPLACATPAAAQDAAQANPNYRPGDFVQGIGAALAAPFQIVFTPTFEASRGLAGQQLSADSSVDGTPMAHRNGVQLIRLP